MEQSYFSIFTVSNGVEPGGIISPFVFNVYMDGLSVLLVCTSLLRDTIEYYNENGSDCYLLLLDASKPFVREYVRLFRTLSD